MSKKRRSNCQNNRLHLTPGQEIGFIIQTLQYNGTFQTANKSSSVLVLDDPFERNFIAAHGIDAVQMSTDCTRPDLRLSRARCCKSRTSSERAVHRTSDEEEEQTARKNAKKLFRRLLRQLINTTVNIQFGQALVDGSVFSVKKDFVILKQSNCSFLTIPLDKILVVLVPLLTVASSVISFAAPQPVSLQGRAADLKLSGAVKR